MVCSSILKDLAMLQRTGRPRAAAPFYHHRSLFAPANVDGSRVVSGTEITWRRISSLQRLDEGMPMPGAHKRPRPEVAPDAVSRVQRGFTPAGEHAGPRVRHHARRSVAR